MTERCKPSPAWLDEDDPQRSKPEPAWVKPGGDRAARTRRSRKNEQALAKRLGGHRLPASGGRPSAVRQVSQAPYERTLVGVGPTARGDLIIPGFLVELKETEHKSIGLKREWLEKVTAGARAHHVDPALVVRFLTAVGEDNVELVVLPMDVFERLRRERGDLEDD